MSTNQGIPEAWLVSCSLEGLSCAQYIAAPIRQQFGLATGRESRSGNDPKMMAKRTIQRTRTHSVLQEQAEGLRSQGEVIEELANEIVREVPGNLWK